MPRALLSKLALGPGDAMRHLVQVFVQVVDLLVLVIHVDSQQIADRQHGYKLALAHDWQVADVGQVHLVDRRLVILVDIGDDELGGHSVFDRRTGRVESTADHALYDVAFREYPDQLIAVEHGDDPDVVLGPQVRRLGHGGLAFHREEKAIAHDIAKFLHNYPPWKASLPPRTTMPRPARCQAM